MLRFEVAIRDLDFKCNKKDLRDAVAVVEFGSRVNRIW